MIFSESSGLDFLNMVGQYNNPWAWFTCAHCPVHGQQINMQNLVSELGLDEQMARVPQHDTRCRLCGTTYWTGSDKDPACPNCNGSKQMFGDDMESPEE